MIVKWLGYWNILSIRYLLLWGLIGIRGEFCHWEKFACVQWMWYIMLKSKYSFDKNVSSQLKAFALVLMIMHHLWFSLQKCLCWSSFRRIARKDKRSFPGRKRLRLWWCGIRRGKCFEKAFEKKSIFFRIPPSPFSQRELHIPLQASALLRRERM